MCDPRPGKFESNGRLGGSRIWKANHGLVAQRVCCKNREMRIGSEGVVIDETRSVAVWMAWLPARPEVWVYELRSFYHVLLHGLPNVSASTFKPSVPNNGLHAVLFALCLRDVDRTVNITVEAGHLQVLRLVAADLTHRETG